MVEYVWVVEGYVPAKYGAERYVIRGVFTTRENAEAFCCDKPVPNATWIKEYILDKPVD